MRRPHEARPCGAPCGAPCGGAALKAAPCVARGGRVRRRGGAQGVGGGPAARLLRMVLLRVIGVNRDLLRALLGLLLLLLLRMLPQPGRHAPRGGLAGRRGRARRPRRAAIAGVLVVLHVHDGRILCGMSSGWYGGRQILCWGRLTSGEAPGSVGARVAHAPRAYPCRRDERLWHPSRLGISDGCRAHLRASTRSP